MIYIKLFLTNFEIDEKDGQSYTISSNYIGVSPGGTYQLSNGGYGIVLSGVVSSHIQRYFLSV